METLDEQVSELVIKEKEMEERVVDVKDREHNLEEFTESIRESIKEDTRL